MHEYSVVANLIELCEEVAIQNNAVQVSKAFVTLGEKSGIDKALLISAFETFKLDSSVCKDTQLDIQMQEILLKCNDCGSEFSAGQNCICPKCDSKNTTISKGKELHLMRVELESKS